MQRPPGRRRACRPFRCCRRRPRTSGRDRRCETAYNSHVPARRLRRRLICTFGMTTIVIVRKGDTAAIAADSLTTFGETRLAAVHDRHDDKTVPSNDTYNGPY